MDIEANFKLLYQPLCLYAMHYLDGDVDKAEDIVQECYVKLWENRQDASRPYLYRMVRNACIDYLRKSKQVIGEIMPKDMEGMITDEEAQDRSEREAKLWVEISKLPEQCRKILLMNKRDGMKYREIAEELNLSEKTVEHQISKALKRLRGKREEILFVLCL